MITKEEKLKRQREYRIKNKNSCTFKYEKTVNGFLMRLYRNMKERIDGTQKEKWHLYKGKYLLPKENFYIWARKSTKFKRMFRNWEESGYNQKLTPTVDRKNSRWGYFLGNMRWLTNSENSRLGGINRWRNKPTP